MKKICTVCGQGLGSSLIIEMNVNSVIADLKLDAKNFDVSHQNLNSYSSSDNYDVVICGADLADSIEVINGKKIILQNLMDKNELKAKLEKIL